MSARLPWGWMALGAAVTLALGFLSGQAAGSTEANPWFQSLRLPVWQPPGAAFGIVWSVLYALMGAAAAIVWRSGHPQRGVALGVFALQLVANLAWSPLFFAAHEIAASLALLVGILFMALGATLLFARVRPLAGWMLVPYLVWLCYAAVLNLRILQLN